jgi:hypothetical protein
MFCRSYYWKNGQRKLHRKLREIADFVGDSDLDFFFNVYVHRTDNFENIFLPVGLATKPYTKEAEDNEIIEGRNESAVHPSRYTSFFA